jgi:actin-like ATPase involved in cell morphogenesis
MKICALSFVMTLASFQSFVTVASAHPIRVAPVRPVHSDSMQIQLYNASVEDVADLLRSVYQNQQTQPTIGIDAVRNRLLISADAALLRGIRKIVQDVETSPAVEKQRMRIVTGGNGVVDPILIEEAFRAIKSKRR